MEHNSREIVPTSLRKPLVFMARSFGTDRSGRRNDFSHDPILLSLIGVLSHARI